MRVISVLYHVDEYGERSEIGLSQNFSRVSHWVKLYAAEIIKIVRHKNGCTLNVIYYNGLHSVSSFQTMGDVVHLIKNWTMLKKQEDRVEFFYGIVGENEYIGDNVQSVVEWYERMQHIDEPDRDE